MSKIVRYEFLGHRGFLLVCCLSVIGIPFAILYLLESMVAVHEDMGNPNEFLERWHTAHK